jgi:hypothetical protein
VFAQVGVPIIGHPEFELIELLAGEKEGAVILCICH